MGNNEKFDLKGYMQDLTNVLECLNRLIENLKTGGYKERAETLQEMYDKLAIRVGDEGYMRDYWILYRQLGV